MNNKEIAMRKTMALFVLVAAAVWPVMAQQGDFEIKDGVLVKYRGSAAPRGRRVCGCGGSAAPRGRRVRGGGGSAARCRGRA
jgi:hypothetical protein